jgi:hypothetical protein
MQSTPLVLWERPYWTRQLIQVILAFMYIAVAHPLIADDNFDIRKCPGGKDVPILVEGILPKEPPVPDLRCTGDQVFARFAWKEFIALNWPAVNSPNRRGIPDEPQNKAKFFEDVKAPRVWETWKQDWELFQSGAQEPTLWHDDSVASSPCDTIKHLDHSEEPIDKYDWPDYYRKYGRTVLSPRSRSWSIN